MISADIDVALWRAQVEGAPAPRTAEERCRELVAAVVRERDEARRELAELRARDAALGKQLATAAWVIGIRTRDLEPPITLSMATLETVARVLRETGEAQP